MVYRAPLLREVQGVNQNPVLSAQALSKLGALRGGMGREGSK